ncbi:hypothetical protein HC891_18315, partial [Candidatus Gracilibacteria bacterium]|nr:hypothetical protein [Candidatus Gracilibacteria bacterium]
MARETITVGGFSVAPGARGYGYLHVGHLAARTEVRIPLQVVNGASDGPVLCLEATLHGWEPMGAEILRRALQRIDPAQLRGTIYCLPLASPFSVEFGGSVESTGTRVNPADLLDLNRVWPGKNRERLAHRADGLCDLDGKCSRRCQYPSGLPRRHRCL